MLSPTGAEAPVLLTCTSPVPWALAALYLPARLPQAATKGQMCSLPTSWQWGVVCRWGLKCVPTTGWHPSAQSSQETLLSDLPVLILVLSGACFAASVCENAPFQFSSQKIRTDHNQESFPSSWCSHRAASPLTQNSLIQYSPLRTADFWPLSACSDRRVLYCLLGASSAAESHFHSMLWPALSWTVTLLCYFYIFSGLPCAIMWIFFLFDKHLLSRILMHIIKIVFGSWITLFFLKLS